MEGSPAEFLNAVLSVTLCLRVNTTADPVDRFRWYGPDRVLPPVHRQARLSAAA